MQLEDNMFLEEDKKGKNFIMKNLLPRKIKTIENIPWINQPMIDWNVQVL